MQYLISRSAELLRPMMPERLHFPLHAGDRLAHRFRISVTNGGEAADLTGRTVTACFLRGDGAAIVFSGSAENDRAEAVLPPACYDAPGEGMFTLRLTDADGSHACTVYACSLSVTSAESDTLIDPEQCVPSLDELITQAAQCADAARDARQAAAQLLQSAENGAFDGRGLNVSGVAADASSLPETAPVGEAWGVGTEAPYDLWIMTRSGWTNFGPVAAGQLSVNGILPDRAGAISLTAEDIPVSAQDTRTVSRAIESAAESGKWTQLASGTLSEGARLQPAGLTGFRFLALRVPYGLMLMTLPGDGASMQTGLIGGGMLYTATVSRSGGTLTLTVLKRQTVSASGAFGAQSSASVSVVYGIP